MKKPIKFREGKIVFGNFSRARYSSVAKVAAYDKYGRRVYEGDIFGIPSGTEIVDILIKNVRLKEGASHEETD